MQQFESSKSLDEQIQETTKEIFVILEELKEQDNLGVSPNQLNQGSSE